MAERTRFFLALELDPGLKRSLGVYTAGIAPLFAKAKPVWVNPDLYHLTLHFFGPAGPDFPAILGKGMGLAAAAAHRPHVSSEGLAYLPSRGEPRVFCLAFNVEPRGLLDSILTEAKKRAAATMTQDDGRPWLPHLTLARLKVSGAPPLSTLPLLPRLEFLPTSCTLFGSILLSDGPRHRRLADFDFDL
ncbi:MAG: hypothetical protein NT061_07415 [Spirochaetes bacterium]|nr:hypothetical protein [Spirochaetota bacterium]